ncbi:murein L,D-transpeptidase catalytic domain-containing protein [Halobacteriovorax marinus]|uniref:murein L,D-transpeptidase catalytic domain-containing protein n=1 Tax=Halobacteriovorax marinus TaxID=97084 RepID=UPI003A90AE7C
MYFKKVFLLFSLLFSMAHAQQDWDMTLSQMYSQFGKNSGIDFNAFSNGITGYYSLRLQGQTSDSPIFSIIDFNEPSNRHRWYFFDLSQGRFLFNAPVSHGARTGELMSQYFSNVSESNKSSLGFYKTGRQKKSSETKFHRAMYLYGLDDNFNGNVYSRNIIIHNSAYVRYNLPEGQRNGRSLGCFAVPNGTLPQKLMTLLSSSGATIIYAHHDQLQSQWIDKEKAMLGYEQSNFSSVPLPMISDEDFQSMRAQDNPQFSNISTQSIAAQGGEIQDGSQLYQKCQQLSNKPWAQQVKESNGSGAEQASDSFRASYLDLQEDIEGRAGDNITNDVAVDMAKERAQEIQDCTATSFLNSRTADLMPGGDGAKSLLGKILSAPGNFLANLLNLFKADPGSSKTIASNDGAIECEYNGAEAQDFPDCVKMVDEYNQMEVAEIVQKEQQEETYDQLSKDRIEQVKNDVNIQDAAQQSFKDAQTTLQTMSSDRAALLDAKMERLSELRDALPTKESLLSECQQKMSRVKSKSSEDFQSFTDQFKIDSSQAIDLEIQAPCTRAIEASGANLVQNRKAAHQANDIIIKYGDKSKDYFQKALRFKAQRSDLDGVSSSSFDSINIGSFDADSENENESSEMAAINWSKSKSKVSADKVKFSGGNGLKSFANSNSISSSSSNSFNSRFNSLLKNSKNKRGANSNTLNFKGKNTRSVPKGLSGGYIGEADLLQQRRQELEKEGRSRLFNNHRSLASQNSSDSSSGTSGNPSTMNFDINTNEEADLFKIISKRYMKSFY